MHFTAYATFILSLIAIICNLVESSQLCESHTSKRCPWDDMDGTKFNALQLQCYEFTPKAFGEVVKTFEVDSSKVNPIADKVPTKLRLYFSLGHSRVGDLSAKLEHEGKTVTLFTGQPSDSAVRCETPGLYIQITANDANAPTIDGSKCSDMKGWGLGYTGIYRAHGVGLSAFEGTSIAGIWTLTITDPIKKSEIEFDHFYILFEGDDVANCDTDGGRVQNANPLFDMYSIGSTALVSIISCLAVFGVCLLIYFAIKGFGLMLEVKDKKGYKSVSLEDGV